MVFHWSWRKECIFFYILVFFIYKCFHSWYDLTPRLLKFHWNEYCTVLFCCTKKVDHHTKKQNLCSYCSKRQCSGPAVIQGLSFEIDPKNTSVQVLCVIYHTFNFCHLSSCFWLLFKGFQSRICPRSDF